MAPRYALYAAPPPGTSLWRFGSTLIGYDAAVGDDCTTPPIAGMDSEAWRALTEDPRRYGFHGTLKAPFRLATGFDEADLRAAVTAFAADRPPVPVGSLGVTALGQFFALCPEGRPQALHELADSVVMRFDRFRAPLSEAEIAKRKPERLTARQRAYLGQWGYPYVLEEFRYHMTLTGPVPADRATVIDRALQEAYRLIQHEPFTVDAVVIFKQEAPDTRFRVLSRHPLG